MIDFQSDKRFPEKFSSWSTIILRSLKSSVPPNLVAINSSKSNSAGTRSLWSFPPISNIYSLRVVGKIKKCDSRTSRQRLFFKQQCTLHLEKSFSLNISLISPPPSSPISSPSSPNLLMLLPHPQHKSWHVKQIFKKDEAFNEVVNIIHSAKVIGETPVEVIVFYAGTKKLPLTIFTKNN